MTSVLLAKSLNGFSPADPAAEELLGKLKHGELVRADVRRSRNLAHHRKFFAILQLVHQNLPEQNSELYPKIDNLLDAIKLAVGLREPIYSPKGELLGFRPGSIAFHKMDQGEFEIFYNQVLDLIVKHFLPGVTDAELRQEVENMVGIAA